MFVETGAETSTRPEVVASARRKLLVLDINGFLIDTYRSGARRPVRAYDSKVNKFFVYNRPFCNDFIRFCLDHFVAGVWSSAQKNNVQAFVEYIFREAKEKLAFVWHQEHCTNTGFRHPDNHHKPVFLKELWKLWSKIEADLPWEAGDYGPSNTLLIDDSPSKAMKNPPHTAIFPKTYSATDSEDNYLGKELLMYLQGLLQMADVQAYILKNPIGEPSIAMGDPRWSWIFLSLKAQGRGRLVASRVVRTNQSVQDVPSGSANGVIPRTLHKRGEQVLASLENQDGELEQNPGGEDGNNLQSMLQKLRLQDVAP